MTRDNFAQVILESDKDVLLMFHSEVCSIMHATLVLLMCTMVTFFRFAIPGDSNMICPITLEPENTSKTSTQMHKTYPWRSHSQLLCEHMSCSRTVASGSVAFMLHAVLVYDIPSGLVCGLYSVLTCTR